MGVTHVVEGGWGSAEEMAMVILEAYPMAVPDAWVYFHGKSHSPWGNFSHSTPIRDTSMEFYPVDGKWNLRRDRDTCVPGAGESNPSPYKKSCLELDTSEEDDHTHMTLIIILVVVVLAALAILGLAKYKMDKNA